MWHHRHLRFRRHCEPRFYRGTWQSREAFPIASGLVNLNPSAGAAALLPHWGRIKEGVLRPAINSHVTYNWIPD